MVLKKDHYFCFLFLLGLSLRFVFPNDVSFVNDETKFLKIALDANSNGDLYSLGLEGAKGVKYGPLTIYWFRLLLSFTHNPLWLSNINIFLITASLSLGLYHLSKLTRESISALGSLAFTSPFLWFYGRNLWDNSLNLVLVLFSFTFFLAFVKTDKFRYLLASSLFLNCMYHIHPMSLSIALTYLLYSFIFKRDLLSKNLGTLIAILSLNLIIATPYTLYFIEALSNSTKSPVRRPMRSFTNSFLGAQIFSTFNFSYFLGKKWQFIYGNFFGLLISAIGGLTWFAYPASFISMLKTFKNKSRNVPSEVAIASIAVLCQAIYYFILKIYGHPHYMAMNWIFILILINYCARGFSKIDIIYRSVLAISLVIIIAIIHLNGGSRHLHYGQTLGNQIQIAKELNKNKSSLVYSKAFHPKAFPHTIDFLRELLGKEQREGEVALLDYNEGSESENAQIKVVKKSEK